MDTVALESLLTIRSVTARAVTAPLARPLRTASGDVPVSPLLLIDVASEEGPVGRAYIFGYTTISLRALQAFLEDLSEVVRGRPAAPAAVYDDLAARFRLMGRQGFVGMALSGLDMALWDLQGRAQQRPVVELLGGGRRRCPPTTATAWSIRSPMARRWSRASNRVFGRSRSSSGSVISAWTSRRSPRCATSSVRRAADGRLQPVVDGAEALRRIRALARFDLEWVEEPVPAEDLAGHARLRQASPVPIQTGENWWFGHDMEHALAPAHATAACRTS